MKPSMPAAPRRPSSPRRGPRAALVLALVLGGGAAAGSLSARAGTCAAGSASPCTVTSQASVPLDGSVYDSSTAEWVDIVSTLHLVSTWTFSADASQLDIHANIARAQAIGRSSGQAYGFEGADSTEQTHPPGPIFSGVQAALTFELGPPSPIRPPGPGVIPPTPIRVGLVLDFDQGGTLSAASASFASTIPN